MDEFTESLQRDKVRAWSDHYLDYKLLVGKVDAAAAPNQDERTREQKKDDMQTTLDKEIKGVLSFYAKEVEHVQQNLQQLCTSYDKLEQQVQSGDCTDLRLTDSHLQKLQRTGEHVSNVLQYVSLNVRGIRKVLNKFSRSLSPQEPEEGCMALEVERPHHPGSHTFQGTSLSNDVAKQLDDMFEHRELTNAADTIKKQYHQVQKWQKELHKHGAQTGGHTRPAASAANQQMDEIVRRLSSSEYWAERNTDLIHTITQQERWAGIYEKAPTDDKASGGLLGLAINCGCAALYMANYQLILPDIDKYLKHIGATSSWSGIVIGACDVATLPGALGYSLWSNRSFKLPLLAASLACIGGNMLYGVGHDAKALWILLASRLLVGLGSARTVNRRYIADFVSKQNRTKASAAFVTSSAVGMACGPLLALPLSYLPTMTWGPISIDPVTAGGWVMGLLWLAFLLLTVLLFQEPNSGSQDEEEGRSNSSENEPLMDSAAERDSDAEEGQAQGAKRDHDEKSEQDESAKQQKSATILMFCVLFLVKLVQQGFLSSLSIFTINLYGWSTSQSGLTLAVYGFALIPLNVVVGKASNSVSDRLFSMVLLVAIAVGSACCISSGKPMWLFFLGGALVFMGSMTLEGSAMSLLSKVMSPSLAQGTFNTGLLTTEAGGFGRLGGNLAISAFSKLSGTDSPSQVYSFGRYLFGLLTVLTIGNAAYFGSMWSKVSG